MCNCIDIDMGSYDNQIILGYYPVMRDYKRQREIAELSTNGICVDRCISEQVIELWKAGIRTYGSCCGHNKIEGFINVDVDDFENALSLGWEKYEYPDNCDRCDTIKIVDT